MRKHLLCMPLNCVSIYCGVAVNVDPPDTEVGMLFFCSLLLQEDSTLHVPSMVFVCARVLTLRPREVMSVVVPLRAAAPVLRTRSATAIKLQVLRFVLKFCA